MKHICIKTNNTKSLKYLLNLLDNSHIKDICYSCNNFKYYKNIIVHCRDYAINILNSSISEFLSFLVIESYEETIIKRLIYSNYFYFDTQERNTILEITMNLLSENDFVYIDNRQLLLQNIFYEHLSKNNTIILDGFINFRIKKYLELLNSVIDEAVNQFIIEREYWEFISLLKVYINSEVSSIDQVHLIYNDSETILLDEKNNIIDIDKDAFKAKYLSDITFSTNDYILNTLLNLIPKKIYIHLSDRISDEFINTLQLVFESRVKILDEVAKRDGV